ncbi:MAG: glucosamine-6-phosphate deaminase [Planctomycetota bacterium]
MHARGASRAAEAAPRGSAPAAPQIVTTVHGSAAEAVGAVAKELADLVRERPDAVLGLATGGTMVGLYAELVRLSRDEGLDLSGVTTFNLDEYLGLAPGDERSFRAFMREHLFEPLGHDDRGRHHFPDVALAERDPLAASRAYEDAIAEAGGIDLQLLGLGRNAHVAFNEPGSLPASRTRVVELDASTRADAEATFGSLDAVPTHAITVGPATILEARRLRVLAFGERKAEAVARTLTGAPSVEVPSTVLRGHADVHLVLDLPAASGIGRR